MLRRFLKATVGSDPSVLALELVVLVAGVFLGVQVDRWFEERQEAREDRRYLQRLADDIDAMGAIYDGMTGEMQTLFDEAMVSLRALESCTLPPEGEAPLLKTFSTHQVLLTLPAVRTTYDEMVASGAFARIENRELKAAVVGLFSFIDSGLDSINYLRTDLGRASELILGTLDFSVDETGQLALAALDFETACTATPIRSATAEIADSRADWMNIGGQIQRQLGTVTSLLDAELGT